MVKGVYYLNILVTLQPIYVNFNSMQSYIVDISKYFIFFYKRCTLYNYYFLAPLVSLLSEILTHSGQKSVV